MYANGMSDILRYVMAALLTLASAFKVRHILLIPPGTEETSGQWAWAAAWMAGALAYLVPTPLMKSLADKVRLRRWERRRRDVFTLYSSGNLECALQAVRQAVGEAPRRFPAQDLKGYLLTPMPAWCGPGEGCLLYTSRCV